METMERTERTERTERGVNHTLPPASAASFPEYYASVSPIPFYVMMALFVFSNMLLIVSFRAPVSDGVQVFRLGVNTVLLISCVMYIALHLILWRMEARTILLAVGLITVTGFAWNFIGQTNEFFCTVVAVLLSLLAWQRDFRMILKIVLLCHIGTMLVGALGLPLGLTQLVYKVQTTDNGFSMGLIYPNHVGRMLFLILMIAWYLWLQERRVLTTILFWLPCYFMWSVVKCRTITLFLIGFPVCWWVSALFQKRNERRNERLNEKRNEKPNEKVDEKPNEKLNEKLKAENAAGATGAARALKTLWDWILIAFPFLCMLLTYILGRCRSFFMTHWHYGQGIYALWMRFISAGILFTVYKFPLFGRDILDENAPMEFSNGQFYMADIVDNAYIYYLIAIGGIALIACMLWLSFGAYRAVRNQDRAFLLMFFFLCGYGLIEIVLFQFEHNFLFFYPLTATAMAYRKKAPDCGGHGVSEEGSGLWRLFQ